MTLETNAIKCFSKAAADAPEQEVKGLYQYLADWEKQHSDALKNLYNSLQEDFFTSSNLILFQNAPKAPPSLRTVWPRSGRLSSPIWVMRRDVVCLKLLADETDAMTKTLPCPVWRSRGAARHPGVPATASFRRRGLANEGSHDDRRRVAECGMSRAGCAAPVNNVPKDRRPTALDGAAEGTRRSATRR
jgi:hypothetical protein